MEDLKNKVPTEVATKEIQDFVYENMDVKKQDFEIAQDYPQMLKAVEQGYLTFDDKHHPVLTLKEPIKNDEDIVTLSEVKFRNRIKPSQLKEIMKGLDISKNQIEYLHRQLAYITFQPVAMLDKFSKFDYKVIDQIATVFL